jgi:CheY-like chemotaxis protein
MQAGYKDIMSYVDQAFNGLEAVQSVKKAYHEGYSYAIIFMDASMPLLDGYEATDEIRKFIRRMNILQPMIVATTGHTE